MNLLSIVRGYRDTSTLPFRDGGAIRGSCYRSAMELAQLIQSHGYEAVVMEKTAGGYHAVAAVRLCGKLVKIDFTGRQFDPKCGVPLVGDSVARNSIDEFWRANGFGFDVCKKYQPRATRKEDEYGRARVMQDRIMRRHGKLVPKRLLEELL